MGSMTWQEDIRYEITVDGEAEDTFDYAEEVVMFLQDWQVAVVVGHDQR